MERKPFRRIRRATRWLALGMAAAMAAAACAGNEPGEARTGTFAFVGVHVLPMDREEVLRDQTVVVEGERIVSVAPAARAEIPDGAVRIDGKGRYLMPGLAEMHGHVPGPDEPQRAYDTLFLYVSNGVTTVRNMAGHPWHLELRERIARGELEGPTLFAASPWVGAVPPGEAERLVRQRKAEGFDLIKTGDIPPAAYARLASAAHAVGMPFGGHVSAEVGLRGALDARQTSIDHLDRYVEFLVPEGTDTGGRERGFFGSGWVQWADEARIADAVRRTREAGTWNVPTLSLVEHLASPEPAEAMIRWPEMRYMPAEVRAGWVEAKKQFQARADFQPDAAQRLVALRRTLLRELHAGGAPVALGSDAPQFFNVPGFSIHHELRMMVAAGLTPYQALAAGTRAPADYFGTPDAFGAVRPGRRADLILLEANPLEDVANLRRRAGVMARGRWWPEAGLQARLEQVAARNAE